ncbi:MAG: DUF3151 family protein [Actinobacteria bacterium]|nr:DUF3151 family protein [Actinomycetota bacterium]
MSDKPVHLTAGGPPETILPEIDPHANAELETALSIGEPATRRREILLVVARYPTMLAGWASVGDTSSPGIEAYMAYRVGYHRGLDSLRANSWRGSGYVRWRNASNRGFLRCLAGLAKHARLIGETSEAVRCEQFLTQLDPSGDATHLLR